MMKDTKIKKKKNNNKKISFIKKIVIIILLLIVFLGVTFILYKYFLKKDLKITNFTTEEKVLVNNEYKDPSFSICYGTYFDCKNVSYQVEGEVDSNKIGKYTLTYNYKIEKQNKKLKREVLVYDDIKPEIIIDEELNFCKNGNLGSGKYHAIDNYDGDLTDQVKFSIEGDKSYLSVADSSNNLTSIEVPFLEFISDPTITLKGDKTIYLSVGNTYNEPGFTASDICDGDITDKVNVSGSVNTNSVGTYTLTYSVANTLEKVVSVIRTIKVIKPVTQSTVYPGDKKIYLTFDDGPGPYTSKLLNILDKYNIKVTFFVTNQFQNVNYQKLIGEEKRRGHVVAIHSYTHNFNIYRSVDTYFNDLNKMNNLIEQYTGEKTKYVRFPGGSSNTVSRRYASGIMKKLATELTNRGYKYYDWNLDSCDSNSAHTKQAVKNCTINRLKGGTYMILMHDIKSYTVDAVDEIIPYALENGYQFLSITDTTPTFHQRINN